MSLFIKFKMQNRQSCLHDLFTAIGAVPTRQTISFKKAQKAKKISISLQCGRKKTSTKKLTLSKSLKRALPNQNLSAPTVGIPESTNTQTSSLKPNKGLNFHPKKISFNNQIKPKVVSQKIVGTYQRQSTCPSLRIKPRKNSEATSQKITQGKVSSYHDENIQQIGKVRERKNSSPESPNTYIAKIEKIIENTKRMTTDIQPSSTFGFELHQTKDDFDKKNTFTTVNCEQVMEKKKQSDDDSKVNSLMENQNHEAEVKDQQIKEESFIRQRNRLGEGVNTVISHYDESSKKSESLCFSNVIFKMNGDSLRPDTEDCLEFNEIYQRGSLNEAVNTSQYFQKQEEIKGRPSLNFKKNHEHKSFYIPEISEEDQVQKIKENELVSQAKSIQIEDFQIQQIQKDVNYETIQRYDLESFQEIYEAFQKINYLGVGRFASVYLCRAKSTYFLFAMKEVLKFTVEINNLEQQISQEITVQSFLNHPNILSLYRTYNDKKKIYMLLEYGEDTLFKKLQKENALSEDECLRCLWEIGQGIQYLHEKKICHRDIKPENIIIVNGVCKIGDFGWCKVVQHQETELCGTPCYVSPQIQTGQPYTVKTDCWSLGVLAYEILSGPLDQQYFQGVPFRYQNLKFPQTTSTEYKQICRALLQTNQQDRPTVNQLLNSFECFKQFFPPSC